MKIWCQSVGALGKNPLWDAYEKALKKHLKSVVEPGNTAEIHGVEVMSPALSWLHYAEYLNTSQVIDNALRAEREGYDAFAVLCMDDPAFFELRQILNITVVSCGETAFYMACQLAPRFAILSYNAAPLRRQTENAKHYGLGERIVPSDAFGITLTELAAGFENPEPIIKGAEKVARKAAKQGATMLVPGCGCLNMVLVANKIRKLAGVPVLDVTGTAVKMAEVLGRMKSRLGIERSSLGEYAQVAKEELSSIRQLYSVE